MNLTGIKRIAAIVLHDALGKAGVSPDRASKHVEKAVQNSFFIATQIPGLAALATGFALHTVWTAGTSVHDYLKSNKR